MPQNQKIWHITPTRSANHLPPSAKPVLPVASQARVPLPTVHKTMCLPHDLPLVLHRLPLFCIPELADSLQCILLPAKPSAHKTARLPVIQSCTPACASHSLTQDQAYAPTCSHLPCLLCFNSQPSPLHNLLSIDPRCTRFTALPHSLLKHMQKPITSSLLPLRKIVWPAQFCHLFDSAFAPFYTPTWPI